MQNLKLNLSKALKLTPADKVEDFKVFAVRKLNSESNCFAREARGIFAVDAEYYRRLKDKGITEIEIFDTLELERSTMSFHDYLTFLSQLTDKTCMFDFLREYIDAVAFEVALLEKQLKR